MNVLVRASKIEGAVGIATFVAGSWVFTGPLLLDHAAAQDGFRSYQVAMALAALIALAGAARAAAPLRLPHLGTLTVALAVVLAAVPMMSRWSNGSLVLQMNQVVVGTAIALCSVATAALRSSVIGSNPKGRPAGGGWQAGGRRT